MYVYLYYIYSNTYNNIEERADRIWKIQYNDLLREYLFRSPSVPPLNLFSLIKQLIPTNAKSTVTDWRNFLDNLLKLTHLSTFHMNYLIIYNISIRV